MAEPATVAFAAVCDQPLVAQRLTDLVAHERAGAITSFVGTVREHDHGRQVHRLEYQAHTTAAERMQQVLTEVTDREGVLAVAAAHRVGVLEVGEVAVVAAVSAEHRDQAFATCQELVDQIKERVPIWKHQVFADGTSEWVGSQ